MGLDRDLQGQVSRILGPVQRGFCSFIKENFNYDMVRLLSPEVVKDKLRSNGLVQR